MLNRMPLISEVQVPKIQNDDEFRVIKKLWTYTRDQMRALSYRHDTLDNREEKQHLQRNYNLYADMMVDYNNQSIE